MVGSFDHVDKKADPITKILLKLIGGSLVNRLLFSNSFGVRHQRLQCRVRIMNKN